MKVFSFDPSEHRDTFLSQGWLHIKQGVTPEFVEVMKEFVARELSEEQLKQFALAGKKGQGRFEFPPEVDFPGEMFDVIAEVCGLDRGTIALSERHINAYNNDAKPGPRAAQGPRRLEGLGRPLHRAGRLRGRDLPWREPRAQPVCFGRDLLRRASRTTRSPRTRSPRTRRSRSATSRATS